MKSNYGRILTRERERDSRKKLQNQITIWSFLALIVFPIFPTINLFTEWIRIEHKTHKYSVDQPSIVFRDFAQSQANLQSYFVNWCWEHFRADEYTILQGLQIKQSQVKFRIIIPKTYTQTNGALTASSILKHRTARNESIFSFITQTFK